MKEVKISVIIPVYESQKYIKACLESVLSQAIEDIEIICVYDESKDASLDIIKKYADQHRNIKVICNKYRMGISRSRNIGINAAKGKYIQFLDADDMLEKNALQILYDTAEERNTEILYLNKKIIYESNWTHGKEYVYSKALYMNNVYTGLELFSKFMSNKCFKNINAYTQFFRRDFLLDNSLFFNEKIIYEDFYFYFMCVVRARRVSDLDKDLYIYRRHAGCGSYKDSELHEKSIATVLIDILKYWSAHSFSFQEEQAIYIYMEHIYDIWRKHFNSQAFYSEFMSEKMVDRFLYRCISGAIYVSFTTDEIDFLRGTSEVYIYGAGNVAAETIPILEKNNIRVKALVVSNKGNELQKWGYDIVEYSKEKISKDATFVIALLDNKTKKEIKETLLSAGFKNVFCAVKDK